MLMDAMKSAGPKMIVSRRGEAPAISSTLTRPLAFSICASMPILPTSKPIVFSIWVSSRSSADDLLGVLDLRQHDAVEVLARALDDRDDVAVGPVRSSSR